MHVRAGQPVYQVPIPGNPVVEPDRRGRPQIWDLVRTRSQIFWTPATTRKPTPRISAAASFFA